MKESNMQTFFGKHLRASPTKETEVYELKIIKGKSLSFNAVKDHQIESLLTAPSGLYHKISDQPIFMGQQTRFTAKKPFDCVLFNCQSFVIVWFYKPRQQKLFYKIPIEEYVVMELEVSRKSFTEEMLIERGFEIINISKSNYGAT